MGEKDEDMMAVTRLRRCFYSRTVFYQESLDLRTLLYNILFDHIVLQSFRPCMWSEKWEQGW